MPNICEFQMRITGDEQAVDELITIIKNDYNGSPADPLHFWRVFSAEEGEKYVHKYGVITADIIGDCAWSIATCMREGGYNAREDGNYNGTTLEKETKRLGLVVEYYSQEGGVGFMEHGLISNGKVIVDDCVDWFEYCMDAYENVDEFNEDTGEQWTQEDFAQYPDDCFEVGGMLWDFQSRDDAFNLYQNFCPTRSEHFGDALVNVSDDGTTEIVYIFTEEY